MFWSSAASLGFIEHMMLLYPLSNFLEFWFFNNFLGILQILNHFLNYFCLDCFIGFFRKLKNCNSKNKNNLKIFIRTGRNSLELLGKYI